MERIGAQHQAGSDSLVTGRVFFRVYDLYFSEGLDDVKYSGNQSEASSLLFQNSSTKIGSLFGRMIK